MRNFRVLSMLLLVTTATLGLLITSCGSDLSGEYALQIYLTLDCAGEQRTAQDGFSISIEADGEDITISPTPHAGSKKLSGSGTMTSSTINFEGEAICSDLLAVKTFEFSGTFEGKKTDTSYEGIVKPVNGIYDRCAITSIRFNLNKRFEDTANESLLPHLSAVGKKYKKVCWVYSSVPS